MTLEQAISSIPENAFPLSPKSGFSGTDTIDFNRIATEALRGKRIEAKIDVAGFQADRMGELSQEYSVHADTREPIVRTSAFGFRIEAKIALYRDNSSRVDAQKMLALTNQTISIDGEIGSVDCSSVGNGVIEVVVFPGVEWWNHMTPASQPTGQ